VCVCGSARRRTSKLARGRCARVLCTSTVTVVGGRGGGAPLAGMPIIYCCCCVRVPRAAQPAVRALWECDQDSHGRPVTRRRRRRSTLPAAARPGAAVYIKPAVPLGHAVIRTIRTEPSTRAHPSFVFYCLHNRVFLDYLVITSFNSISLHYYYHNNNILIVSPSSVNVILQSIL